MEGVTGRVQCVLCILQRTSDFTSFQEDDLTNFSQLLACPQNALIASQSSSLQAESHQCFTVSKQISKCDILWSHLLFFLSTKNLVKSRL
jgi:hypothetical protein